MVSAMLQSQQAWLPLLHEPVKFTKYLTDVKHTSGLHKMIAHCEEDAGAKQAIQTLANPAANQLILIGPEGDFTKKEIDFAIDNGCVPVSLGSNRLRTETAGMVAVTLLRNP